MRRKACRRAVAEQGGVLFDAGVDRREGGVRPEDIEGGGLVELGDYECEEGVDARQVEVGREVPNVPFGPMRKMSSRPTTSGGIMSGRRMPA